MFLCNRQYNGIGISITKSVNVMICSHFIVPELGPDVKFSYASHKAVEEYKEAKAVSVVF